MKQGLLLAFLLLSFISFANSEQGCSISALLTKSKSSVSKNVEDSDCSTESMEKDKTIRTSISEKLMSVNVLHENIVFTIEREVQKSEGLCPPFCIEAMSIKNVLTVAELEVLAFIDKLKEKKARLLIDVRENNFYVKGTIPSAINVPFSMLDDGSIYQEEVLKLLGGEVIKNKKWSFPNAQTLLLFGRSATTPEASNAVKKLLALGYPSSKLLYYRAGISAWRALGLTLYKDYSQ